MKNFPKILMALIVRKTQILWIAIENIVKTFVVQKNKLDTHFSIIQSHFMNAVPVRQSIYQYYAKCTVWNIFGIYSKWNIQNFLSLYSICSTA